MAASLVELSDIITNAVASLNNICKETNVSFPTLDEPFTPQSEALRANPVIAGTAKVIAAAAMQLVMNALPTPHAVFNLVTGHFEGAALRVCLEAHVTEILKEAGPKGMHVNDIAAKNGINSEKLGRILRFLATLHVYKELTPDVFTNNRVSSILDTGRTVEELFAKPEEKYNSTSGFSALVSHQLDEVTKSSAYLWESMHDPMTSHSDKPTETAFNRAFHETSDLWSWYASEAQAARQRRFDVAMRGVAAMQHPDTILQVFDWKSLPNESVVVDVGGGVGASSLPLAKEHPHLKIVVQDRPSVVEEGIKVWNVKNPEALKSGRVQLQGHDFFTAQPVKNASVFLLKQIMHDWPNSTAIKILIELRKVAQPYTKLLLIDSVLQFACKDPRSGDIESIPGAVPHEADAPLLANYGVANLRGYSVDIAMMTLFNSLERTVNQIDDILKASGWKLIKVHRSEEVSTFLQPVEAIPA